MKVAKVTEIHTYKFIKTKSNYGLELKLDLKFSSGRVLWKDLAIIQFLATQNLALRGHREQISSDIGVSSSYFLNLVKLVARFDPTLRENLSQVFNKTITKNHYQGNTLKMRLFR